LDLTNKSICQILFLRRYYLLILRLFCGANVRLDSSPNFGEEHIMNFTKSMAHSFGIGTFALLMAVSSSKAMAFDVYTFSIVGVTNTNSPGIGVLDFENRNDSQMTTAEWAQSFDGLNSLNQQQTMSFTGRTVTQANFGRLRSFTKTTSTNVFYNAANPAYYLPDGSYNPNGTPETFVSLGFAGFNDTLQFGGTALQSGYRARYIFRVDGTNSGQGAFASLGFTIQGNETESFFATAPGYQVNTWATKSYEINGIIPQTVNVQFSNQVVHNTFDYAGGSNLSGISDFSSTAVLVGIEVLDENGASASGWTMTSGSGTEYAAVPEPFSVIGLMVGGLLLARRRKQFA